MEPSYDSSEAEPEFEPEEPIVTIPAAAGPAVFRLSGSSGNQPSTVSGRVSALVHFTDFLDKKHLPGFELLTEAQLCDKTLWQEYGTYLSEHARLKHNDDEFLSWGTACQFLSGPKSLAQLKFPNNVLWINQNWHSKIRIDLHNVVLQMMA